MRMIYERGFWFMLLWLMFIGEPMIRPGLPPTEDGVLHAYRVVEMHRLWQAGIFYPRWAPDLAFGLGVPLFHFLGPLFPWLGAVGMSVGLPLELSLKVALAGLLFLGSGGVYGLARLWGLSEWGALIAGLAFAAAPFRVRELYWQGDFPQYLALSLLPWALWALHRALRDPQWHRRFVAAVLIALLPLSHNISAMLSAPLLLGYGLFVWWAERWPWRRVLVGLQILIVALGLVAFFVFPALLDRPLVHLDRLLRGEYDFRKHFVDIGTLFAPLPLFDDRLGNRQLRLTMGPHQVLLALPAIAWGLIGSLKPKPGMGDRPRILAVGCIGALIGMIGMMLPISQAVWERIPLLAYGEFPWRWLGPVALPLAMLIGLSTDLMARRLRGYWMLIAAIVLVLGDLGLLYNGGTPIHLGRASLADLHAYERRHRYPGLISVGELFPKWVTVEIEGSPLEAAYQRGEEPVRLDLESLPPGATARVIERGLMRQRYTVELPVSTSLRFYTFAFPGWTVWVDGRPVSTWAEARTGWLRAEVPAGAHEVQLRFDPPLGWRLLELLSLGLALAGGGRAISAWHRARSANPRMVSIDIRQRLTSWRRWGMAEHAMLWLGVIALIGRGPYRLWEFTRVPLDQPLGAAAYIREDYEGRIRLVGYRLDPPAAPPGGQVRLTLWWRPLRSMETQYSVYVHVFPFGGEPHLAFQSDHMHPADVPTNAWDVERVYRDDHILRIPRGITPGLYRIRVGLYERLNPGRRLIIDRSGEDGLNLPTPLIIARTVQGIERPVTFGGKIRLTGIEAPQALKAGQPWALWLAFEAIARPEADYTLFVHVVDEAGNLIHQRDLWQPTSHWPEGRAIPVAVAIDGLPRPGRYFLRIGWYIWPTMAHLSVDSPSPEKRFYTYPLPIIAVAEEPSEGKDRR
ncbi:MAG TPA: 6-pyruvoyl-tetrahydropterin synthase-related protein [Thermoflexus sp.]|nr:6-pyruvoyl-tetrahydropterin synthase-related protein [Thermoflexus sp.]